MSLIFIFEKLSKPLRAQILDLRSAVAKEACALLTHFAQTYSREFEVHAHKYLSSECLFKMLNSGKKIMVDLAHDCI